MKVCSVCGKIINGHYLLDDWGNVTHLDHSGKRSGVCFCCGRIISPHTSISNKSGKFGFLHNDGRLLCGICQETSVSSGDTERVSRSYANVLALFAKVKINDLPADIPVELTNYIKLSDEGNISYGHGIRGLCKTALFVENGQYKLSAKIFLLSGLPKIQFEGILAHEILHVWLMLNAVDLKQFTEGFCNLGSSIVYNYYAAEKKDELAKVLIKQLDRNSDPEYGTNYKVMKELLIKLGWKQFINEIIKLSN